MRLMVMLERARRVGAEREYNKIKTNFFYYNKVIMKSNQIN